MQITQLDPQQIEVSETLKAIPLAPAEVADPIIADVEARGIDVPLILNKDHELLDGRIRLRGALAGGFPTVPCIVREDGDAMAATIILSSLCQRKHYTKSALAYIAFPLLEDAVREARDRRVENLRQGDKIPERVLSTQSGKPRSIEDICESVGISRKLLYLARNVHGLFKKYQDAQPKFEPDILNGELSLAMAIQGINGWISTRGKPKHVQEEFDFWSGKIKGLIDERKFAGWDRASEQTRRKIATTLADAISAKWPPEVQEEIERRLRRAKREAI
jgi:hypothetical protein